MAAASADNAEQERSAPRGDSYPTRAGCRKRDRNGTLIRHARSFSPAVFPLPVAMIEPSFRAVLMTAVGSPPLSQPRRSAAFRTAIAMSAITVLTDPEHRPAADTESLPQNHAMCRHFPSADGLDNGGRSCQVRPCQSVTCLWSPNRDLSGCTDGSHLRLNRRRYTLSSLTADD